jgi:hypothetical protein
MFAVQELWAVEQADGSRSFDSSPGASASAVSPVQSGIVTDWGAAWAHIARAVGDVRGKRLVIVDSILSPRAARDRWAKEAFETHGVNGICFLRDPVAVWCVFGALACSR